MEKQNQRPENPQEVTLERPVRKDDRVRACVSTSACVREPVCVFSLPKQHKKAKIQPQLGPVGDPPPRCLGKYKGRLWVWRRMMYGTQNKQEGQEPPKQPAVLYSQHFADARGV